MRRIPAPEFVVFIIDVLATFTRETYVTFVISRRFLQKEIVD
jgi:hypothetical protein